MMGSLLLSLALSACGPSPPNYDALAGHRVEACGDTFRADEIVRRAYEADPTGSLPWAVPAPERTVAVASLEEIDGERLRRYPCAEDVDDARDVLSRLRYRSPVLMREDERFFIFEAIDPYGIASTYSIFSCEFVGEVLGRRSGALYHQGLFGVFGENGGEPPGDDHIRALASITFATGMTHLANEGYARLVEGVTLIGSEEDVSLVSHPSNDEAVDGIGVCVTWVEPNLWGGCDAIRVGISRTVVLDGPAGEFHQLPIHSLLDGFYGYAGWCGRRE